MTINDLKAYAKRIGANMKPTDRLAVTLNREATTYIFAYLNSRKRNLEQSLSATNISEKSEINANMNTTWCAKPLTQSTKQKNYEQRTTRLEQPDL